MLWTCTDETGRELTAIGELNLRFRCPLDNMEIRNYVTRCVPYQTGTRSTRHAVNIARPEIGDVLAS